MAALPAAALLPPPVGVACGLRGGLWGGLAVRFGRAGWRGFCPSPGFLTTTLKEQSREIQR